MDYGSIPELGGIEGTYLGDDVGYDDVGDDVGFDDEVGARHYRPRYPSNVRRIHRGAYNRQRAVQAQRRMAAHSRQLAQQQQAFLAQLQANRSAAPAPGVKYGKDVIEVISATGGAAGAVTDELVFTEEFHLSHATFDGSSTDAAITSLMIGRTTVLGPYSTDKAIPASAFKSGSNQKLGLKGNVVPVGQKVTLHGTIAAADDVLKCLLYGKRIVALPGGCAV